LITTTPLDASRAKEVFGWIGKGTGFWGKLRRVGSVGAGVALFGKDLYALGF